MLKPLQLIKSRYLIVEQAGSGGFSTVYRAEDTLLGLPVAIKVGNAGDALSMRREAQFLASLKHKSIPQFRDFFAYRSTWCLAMEWIAGTCLHPTSRLPIRQVIAVGSQLCEVLFYLHHRTPPIIHRDLKLANILLAGDTLFLLDFGISSYPGFNELLGGSRGYAAPEQWLQTDITPRTDVYSLGILLYRLLMGQPFPVPGDSTTQVKGERPPTLQPLVLSPGSQPLLDLIERMTRQEPTQRPDVTDVWQELKHITDRNGAAE